MTEILKQPSYPWVAPRFTPLRCALCERCFKDHKHTLLAGRIMCVFGGPYTGVEDAQ